MKRLTLYILLWLTCVAGAKAQFATDERIDSMRLVYYSLSDDDTAKLTVCHNIAWGHYNQDSSLLWTERLLNLAKRQRSHWYEARAYGFFSYIYTDKNDFQTAMEYIFQSLNVAEKYGYMDIVAWNHYRLGSINSHLHSYEEAMMNYQLAVDIFREHGDSVWTSICSRHLAEIKLHQKYYDEAYDIYSAACRMDSLKGGYSLLSDLMGMGLVNLQRFRDNSSEGDSTLVVKARDYFLSAYNLDCDNPMVRMKLMPRLCDAMYYDILYFPRNTQARQSAALDSMRIFCDEFHMLARKIDLPYGMCNADLCKVNYLILRKDLSGAKDLLDSIDSYIGDRDYESVRDVYYWVKTNYSEAIHDYKAARHYLSLYYETIINYAKIDEAVQSTRRVTEAQFLKLGGEKEAAGRRRLIIGNSMLILLTILLAVVVNYSFRKRRHTRNLDEKNRIITAQNRTMTESINYASLIQKAAMPKKSHMRALFIDYILIYKPLHIVAGDFYWVKKVGNYNVVVCADCTGHGVPGAFVSMLGISLLNELCASAIASGAKAGDILNVLRTRLMYALGQSKSAHDKGIPQNRDGIDLALVMVDSEKMEAEYAGAMRPLWIYRRGDIIKYKADRMPIGLYLGDYKGFTTQNVPIEPGDVLYMFSDGIADQFGYVNAEHSKWKPFTEKRLERLIISTGYLPLWEQKQRIVEAVEDWKNGFPQLDDIILVGVRI